MEKILVANRGEIALRIMRSAREMGIKTVAIYSEADRNALHVRYANEAVCVGPPPSNQSYLLGDKIIQICKDLNVDGVHPGYGFLSENAAFATKLEKAGIVLIGPSAHSMNIMGDKLSAKAAVKSYNIPLVPGTEGAVEDLQEAISTAKEIGFPVMIKASAGGGGKGMRIVYNEETLEEEMNLAISEATSSFGNGAVFIERFVNSPRHIEIQVLADTHGNVVHLFERECSIQRRHQKVVEEAPSSVVSEEMRHRMGECAKDVARACGYVGAGTVEFLVDDKLNFYFLEMNTRLQVEHPVTELITGIDIVKEQIKVARGEKLSFKQEDLKIHGHAIESRVYAEDPQNNFLPDIGKLERYVRPQGAGVRVDDGFEEGMDIPIYYDPMIAKLAVHADNRDEARAKMVRAIDEYQITGVKTTLAFCKFVMEHEAFASGQFDTGFVKDHYSPEMLDEVDESEKEIAALMTAFVDDKIALSIPSAANGASVSRWKTNRV
ncbi:MAG: acetyl-CoA carboxylase biotin carboxylase subunit [Flavobacteriales bacterium]|jgi:acetyl-CoA carboxylase biotin carboxylase subunit|nr:acetyl-CoA carboxylase biotin carboxylase subunit [Flavobacteriales bacterium]